MQPENQRAVADIRDQYLRFVLEPFLVPEEQEDDDHRGADDVVVEILTREPTSGETVDDECHANLQLGARPSGRRSARRLLASVDRLGVAETPARGEFSSPAGNRCRCFCARHKTLLRSAPTATAAHLRGVICG